MCFQLAAEEPSLAAAVVFGGVGPREADIERIACPVLGLYGSLDEYVTKDVPRVARAMARHRKSFEQKTFDRTDHDFVRPGAPTFHGANAQAAWALVEAFFAKHLAAPRGVH